MRLNMWLLIMVFCGCAGLASAQSPLQLFGAERWAELGSKSSLLPAIGMARAFPDAKVARKRDGAFAVISGPHAVGDDRAQWSHLITTQQWPKTTIFSSGADYVETAWQLEPVPTLASLAMQDGADASLSHGPLAITLTSRTHNDDEALPVVKAALNGAPAFEIVFDEASPGMPNAEITLQVLDPASPQPQIVARSFTGGAHCCYDTRIATLAPDGQWHVLKTDMSDGDGFHSEIIAGKPLLVRDDDRFKYRYASYAASIAPPQLFQLLGTELRDVSREPQYRDFYRQQLAMLDYQAAGNADLRESAGFLGGWAGVKSRAGEGDEAMAFIRKRFSRMTEWGDERCLDADMPLEKCPPRRKRKMAFPELLAHDFSLWGY